MGKFTEILERIKLDEMSMGDAVRTFQDEGVEPASLSKAELKTVWRKLQRKYHPDRGGDPKKAQEINQAYDILVGRTSQGRRASRTSEPPPSSGPQYGFRGAEYTQDYAAGQYGHTARDTEPGGFPEWQTDKRSSFNKISRNNYTDVNFIKKDMWEKSGKSKEEWTIQGYDGRFFRGITTVYGNKKIFNDMAEAMVTWQSKGGNPYPTRAVFASKGKDRKLYLIYLDGKFMGDDPYIFEHDSMNLNPSNDQSFMRNLPNELDKISAKTESREDVTENASAGAVGAGAISSLAASVGNRSRNQKDNRGKKAGTIFAVSAEDKDIKEAKNSNTGRYWYNVKTGESLEVPWDEEESSHHLDVVFNNPKVFGLDRSELSEIDSTETLVYMLNPKGWSRIGVWEFKPNDYAIWVDASNITNGKKAVKWAHDIHPRASKAEILTTAGKLISLDLAPIQEAADSNIIRMGGERKSPNQFSPQEITVLRNRYEKIDKIDPLSPSYEKLTDMLDNASDELLKQLAGADIKFVSKLAKNRVMRRGIDEEITIIRRRAGITEKDSS